MPMFDLSDTHEYMQDLLHAPTQRQSDVATLPWEHEIELAIAESPCTRCWKRDTQHLLRRPEFPLQTRG